MDVGDLESWSGAAADGVQPHTGATITSGNGRVVEGLVELETRRRMVEPAAPVRSADVQTW